MRISKWRVPVARRMMTVRVEMKWRSKRQFRSVSYPGQVTMNYLLRQHTTHHRSTHLSQRFDIRHVFGLSSTLDVF
jgi:hypothetical protein